MDLLNYVDIVMGVVGTCVTIASLLVERIPHRRIVAAVGIIFIVFGTCGYLFTEQQSINIMMPLRGSTINGTINPDDNQVTIHDVSVKVAHPIGNDEKIVILIQVRGGSEWFVSGNQVSRSELTKDNMGNFGYSTFGQANDGKNDWVMLAMITSKEFTVTEKTTNPQKYAKYSDIATFRKNGFLISRVQ